LDLYLVPQGQGIGAAVWKSDSTLYNVEHMFFKILQTQRYDLIVRQTSPNPAGITETPFALAWWAQPTRAGAGMVQGTTFVDANKDDTWGTTENGYQGAFVDLYTADGVWVAATTTDSNGQYQFANLDAGDYYVVFTDPEGYTFANEHIGSDDAIDSDVDAYGQSDTFTITDDETVTLDAGLAPLPTGSISGKVWNDTDGDGIQDSGEAARDGVTVSLYDSSDNLLDSTATDADGAYEFNWLPAGDYYVTFAAPVNYGFTTQDAGSDDMLDSDADSSGVTATFTLGTDEEKAYVDAGLVLTASSVQGYIWNDTDSDGIQDNDEYPVPYAEVSLYDSSANLVATTTADDSGHYEFDLLSAGDYYVTFTLPYGFSDFSPQDQGSDDTLDSDADSSGQTATFTLGSTQILDHVDAGLVPVQYATLSGSAWKDLNANGIQDSGEPGAANVFVDLYDSSDNWIDSTLSDADGHYQFLGVVPGDYYVQFNLPDHYVFTSQDAGSDDTVDSDADSSGLTATFTLSVAEELTHLDAGLQPINQAPAGANNTVKTPQDTPYVFTETDFGFTDPNDDPANLFYRVQIVTLPGAGTLTDNGTALSAGDFVTVSDIKNGKLVFTPATGAYGAAYASFTFAVQDDGGTANGGVDTDPTARTMTIDVVQTEPQLFDGEAVTPGPDVAPLTMTQLQPLLDEAIRRWVAATGDAQVGVRLQQAQVHITALSDAVLGLEGDNNIWIDLDAAGHGWFLDPTPGDDSEFANAVDGSEWHAGSDSAAAGRVDLLTVLEHELGHVLGLSDDSGTDLMVTTLGLGVRRLPAAP
ncbi:MAG TPA: SdrD B-like domain-containing protein, partial [Gemmataceae bacterium]|nr:SdrD B-like domain-containing protein [Gemmataceae bacterium]